MRIAIFTDYDNAAPLVEGTLVAVRARPDTEVVGVYTSVPSLLARRRWWRSLRGIVGSLLRGRRPRPLGRTAALCRLHGVPLRVVPDRDPNAASFLDGMRSAGGPDVAFSFWSTSIFGPDWLASFDHAVNFHDARLPDHRGVAGTAMEVYDGLESGWFTFHHIDTGIDTGNILVEGDVPMAGRDIVDVVAAKMAAGARRVGDVVDLLAAGDPGRVQSAGGSYLSEARLRELKAVPEPSELTRAEIGRRIAAFSSVTVPLPGGSAPVTQLARRRGLGWPRIAAADGHVTVTRIAETPAVPYLVARAVVRPFRTGRGPSW